MTCKKHVRAVFTGAFDPITNGHLDVIHRAIKIFDEVIVAVGDNPEKKGLFTGPERVAMVAEVIKDIPRVTVEQFTGLAVAYVKSKNAQVILRGLRNSMDVQYEFQLALTNRAVAGIETVFIMTGEKYGFTTSTLIREVGRFGGDVSGLVPPNVYKKLCEKLANCEDE